MLHLFETESDNYTWKYVINLSFTLKLVTEKCKRKNPLQRVFDYVIKNDYSHSMSVEWLPLYMVVDFDSTSQNIVRFFVL